MKIRYFQETDTLYIEFRQSPVAETRDLDENTQVDFDERGGICAMNRAAKYAKERIVFDRPIGQNQAIQHPLAANWMALEAANLMVFKAAWLYDSGKPSGAEANAAKYLAGEAGFDACQQAVMTHGGFGYAKEYHVERYLRESLVGRIAPVTPQMILCFIAERVLGLPNSY